MKLELTAVFRRCPKGSSVLLKNFPVRTRRGATLDEARENLKEAVQLVLEANRALVEDTGAGKKAIKETLRISAA